MLRVVKVDFVSYCNDGLSTERAKHVSGLLREYLRSIPSAGWFTPSDITLNTGQAGSVIGVMIRVRPITLSPTNSKDKKFYPPKGRLSKGTWYSYDRIVDIYGLEEVGRDGRAPVKMIAVTLAIVLVFLAIVAGLTYFRPTAESTPKPVESMQTEQYTHNKTIPDVTGLDVNVAKQKLERAGYEVKEEYASSNKIKAGVVISQNPPAGTKTSQPVTIKISTGKEGIYPNLGGINQEEAKNILTTLGVSYDIDIVDSNKPEGTVIDSSVQPGSKSKATDRVRIRVASGYNTVPSVTGFSRTEAISVLSKHGFKNVAITEKEVTDSSQVGKVLESAPNSGGRHKLTEKISVTVGKKNNTTTPTPSNTSTVTATPIIPSTSTESSETQS